VQQAVIIHLRLSDDNLGTPEERDALFELQEHMMALLQQVRIGELDGDEFGQGECTLFLYGPNADLLFALVEPLLKACPHAIGGYAIKRYSDAAYLDGAEVRVTW
jgi:hypothetical protein